MRKVFNIKQFVFDYGIKQQELCDVLGIKQPQASLLLNGKRNVREEHMDAMIKKYGSKKIAPYIIEVENSQPRLNATIIPTQIVEEIREDIQRDDLRSAIEAMQKKMDTLEAMIAQQNRMLDIMERMLDNIERK